MAHSPTLIQSVVKQTLIFKDQDNASQVALLQSGQLVEHYQIDHSQACYGDIYYGQVERFINGTEAVLIKIDKSLYGYLHASDVLGKDSDKSLKQHFHLGQKLLLQVKAEAYADKYCQLRQSMSIGGRYVVLVNRPKQIRFSRQLGAEDIILIKHRIEGVVEPLSDVGFIIRHQALKANEHPIAAEVKVLYRQWQSLSDILPNRPVGRVYQAPDPGLLWLQGLENDAEISVIVDNESRYQSITQYIKEYALSAKVSLDDQPETLFYRYGISEQYAATQHRSVPLPNGGNIVIEVTEAVIVIDVNSAASTDGQSVLQINLEAAYAIAREIRLRHLSGMIVIDFLRLNDKQRQQLLNQFKQFLQHDPVPTRVYGFSRLGLFEMVRERRHARLSIT